VWFNIIIVKNVHLKPVFNSVVQVFFEQLTGIQEVKQLLARKKT
jgi:hypothetical protein